MDKSHMRTENLTTVNKIEGKYQSKSIETYLPPAPLIKVSHQIIKAVDHRLILLRPKLNTTSRACFADAVPRTGKEGFILRNGLFNPLPTQDGVRIGKQRRDVGHGVEGFSVDIAFEGDG